jgi:hypothetical protein
MVSICEPVRERVFCRDTRGEDVCWASQPGWWDTDECSSVAFSTSFALYEKSKFLGSGGSMVARPQLQGIDGRAPSGVEPAA